MEDKIQVRGMGTGTLSERSISGGMSNSIRFGESALHEGG
jgi:hypothetical protein